MVAGKSLQSVRFGSDGSGVGEVGVEGIGLGASRELRVVIDDSTTNAPFGQEGSFSTLKTSKS